MLGFDIVETGKYWKVLPDAMVFAPLDRIVEIVATLRGGGVERRESLFGEC